MSQARCCRSDIKDTANSGAVRSVLEPAAAVYYPTANSVRDCKAYRVCSGLRAFLESLSFVWTGRSLSWGSETGALRLLHVSPKAHLPPRVLSARIPPLNHFFQDADVEVVLYARLVFFVCCGWLDRFGHTYTTKALDMSNTIRVVRV